jgi:hypothetical protein
VPILKQYKELELGPDVLSPLEMGYIYEEILRRFSAQSGEEAGEHFRGLDASVQLADSGEPTLGMIPSHWHKTKLRYEISIHSGGEMKLRPGRRGKKGDGLPPRKFSVQDMIDQIRTAFEISDDEALYIRQVTEQKVADPVIRSTVQAHHEDVIYLEGAYRGPG